MPQSSKPTRIDALSVLGLPGSATAEQITAAYRRLARATHPDHTGRTDPAAADRFSQITRAYQRLAANAQANASSKAPVDQQAQRHTGQAIHVSPPTAPLWPKPPLVAGPVVVTPSQETTHTRSRRAT
jgi:preprotein translocase subunit Sec63